MDFVIKVFQRGTKQIPEKTGFLCQLEPGFIKPQKKRFLVSGSMDMAVGFNTASEAANAAFDAFRKYPFCREYCIFNRTTGEEVLHEYAH